MTYTQTAVWNGTPVEFNNLTKAVNRNARENETDGNSAPLPCDTLCAHRMLSDQKTLDRLLFSRRIQQRLWTEEHLGKPPAFPFPA